MRPQQKAVELVSEFYHNNTDYIDSNEDAKESAVTCAILCVNEILNIGLNYSLNHSPNINNQEYWFQVKKELEKL